MSAWLFFLAIRVLMCIVPSQMENKFKCFTCGTVATLPNLEEGKLTALSPGGQPSFMIDYGRIKKSGACIDVNT